MSPLNEEQLHHLRDERKEQIMQAAAKTFARWGFNGAKMSMIATAAGISHGLLYHYFTSKDELFTALLREAMEESYQSVSAVYQFPGSPLAQLEQLTAVILERENTPYFMLVHHTRTSEDVPKEAQQILEQYPLRSYVDLLLPLFEEGQRSGEIVAGDPVELIGDYFSVLSGLMIVNALKDSEYQIPKAERLIRIVKAD